MRYGNEEASTHRKPPAGLAPEFLEYSEAHSEAPTHLPGTRRPLPVTPYVQQSAVPVPAHARITERPLAPLPVREKTERSEHQLQPARESEVKPLPRKAKATPEALPVAAPPAVEAKSKSKSKSKSEKSKSRPSEPSVSAVGSSPSIPAPPAKPSAPEIPGMIDPLQVPVPPELGPTIYGWIRRLALQADLPTADRVLRDALLEISSSLSVTIVYPGQDGLWSLGPDEEIPREAAPIVAVAQARRAMIASHAAMIPIVTTTETVAVILLTRNPRNPAYQPIEQLAMLGLARESAAILHHLAVQHLQKASELKADKGSLYRPEALEAHRSRGQEGVPVHLSPVWVRRTYPFLVATILIGILLTVVIKVPTYSTGRGVVMLQGTTVTSPAMGTVDSVLVTPGQSVGKGTVLVRLQSTNEQDELTNAKAEVDNWTRVLLLEQSDDNAKKQLASLVTRLNTAKSKLEQRTIRAPKAGVISDVRTAQGAGVSPGDQVVTIVDADNAIPEVYAFLPATDRPRLRVGMTLQVGLTGYTKTREGAVITFVSREGMGSAQAAKILGQSLADTLRLPPDGSYVLVKARLPGRTFRTEHNTLSYHHGMLSTTEVKISEKPFLVDMFPALEKYVPN